MKRLVWTIEAQADFGDLDREFAAINPDYAYRVGRAALAAGKFLAEFPQAGPVFDEHLRKWRVRQTDYVLLYRITADTVEILRLEHARRDWRPSRLRPKA